MCITRIHVENENCLVLYSNLLESGLEDVYIPIWEYFFDKFTSNQDIALRTTFFYLFFYFLVDYILNSF